MDAQGTDLLLGQVITLAPDRSLFCSFDMNKIIIASTVHEYIVGTNETTAVVTAQDLDTLFQADTVASWGNAYGMEESHVEGAVCSSDSCYDAPLHVVDVL